MTDKHKAILFLCLWGADGAALYWALTCSCHTDTSVFVALLALPFLLFSGFGLLVLAAFYFGRNAR
jgi:hypothetical protein